MKNKITIFALSASQQLAKDIASKLGTEPGKCKVNHFADGEILVEIGESVRGKDVFIIQSTSSPVTENLMEILILADALKRASAKEITAVIPYFGYARQDRKAKPRQPITSKLVADLLTTAGVTRVVTVDLHAAQIQGFFNIPVDEMQALPLLADYFENKNMDDVCVVSPDHGGATRARKLAVALDAPVAIIDKRRPKPNAVEILGVLGDIKDKNCIVVDDMIDTGGTIVAGIKMLKEKGAKSVTIACTHAVFSGNAVENLQAAEIDEVVVTDTIKLPEDKVFEKLRIVSVAGVLSKTIEHIENCLPVSDVFKKFDFKK
jgi:ribose-phosphate pyrophosphokinase